RLRRSGHRAAVAVRRRREPPRPSRRRSRRRRRPAVRNVDGHAAPRQRRRRPRRVRRLPSRSRPVRRPPAHYVVTGVLAVVENDFAAVAAAAALFVFAPVALVTAVYGTLVGSYDVPRPRTLLVLAAL